MAKKSAVERNDKRVRLVKKYELKRKALKDIINDRTTENINDVNAKFEASQKLAEMNRNSSQVRIRNRCLVSGRPRAFYRKFKLSRIALRDLASLGMLPGVRKASW